jgi:hypothetical protein
MKKKLMEIMRLLSKHNPTIHEMQWAETGAPIAVCFREANSTKEMGEDLANAIELLQKLIEEQNDGKDTDTEQK